MSGRYARTYSRKKPPLPTINQFDRLVSEPGKGTHPVAAKTAGHVGKWGITSFTSLRYVNGSYGKDETSKKTWIDSPPQPSAENVVGDSPSENVSKASAAPKRRKFFKSRDENAGVSPTASQSSTADWLPSHSTTESSTLKDKFNEISNLKSNISPLTIPKPHLLSNKAVPGRLHGPKSSGGIKLKIFKSRNSESNLQDTYSSTVELPSDDSRSVSNSSSGSNSPRLEDATTLEHTTTSSNGEFASDDLMPPQWKRTKHLLDVHLPTSNIALRAYDSTFEFGVLVDQKTGLPISTLASRDEDSIFSKSATSEAEEKEDPIVSHCAKDDRLSKESEDAKGQEVCQPLSVKVEIDTLPKVPLDSVELKDGKNSVPFSETKSNNGGAAPKSESGVDLFSTDFDENEVTDRTSIDYSTYSSGFSEVPLSRSDTLEMIDLWGPQQTSGSSSVLNRSVSTFSSNSQSDTEKEGEVHSSLSKKRSFFKSRSKEGNSKKRATYTHKWHTHEEKEDSYKNDALERKLSLASGKTLEDPFEFDSTPTLQRLQTWPATSDDMFEKQSITTVKCTKEAKKFYTVVKNVKKTHQLQESGEFQEFNDDVEFFLDALRSNTISTRCLASLNLAQKCMIPAFRMHLRAHGTVTKFFRALSDAPSNPRLSESAAIVMFALSQDRLNMDLDRDSLELMLNLLDTDSHPSSEEALTSDVALKDHGTKIRNLCEELQQKGHAKHLKLDHIDAATLAMETLLSLTSKRAGEWFKEELRELGGVDHLIRTVTSCSTQFSSSTQNWSSSLLEKLTKVERCLKVLENITHQNESNQVYLLNKDDSIFAKTLMQFYYLCRTEIPLHPEKEDKKLVASPLNSSIVKGLVTTLTTTMKVLINLTHNPKKEALGSQLLGCEDDIYSVTLYCLLIMPQYLTHETKFEIQVLACCLLLNLIDNSTSNRQRLMKLKSPLAATDEDDEIFKKGPDESAMESLVTLFYSSEESAREQEAHTDHIIDNDLDQESKDDDKKDEDIEETVARLLQKAGRHMEDTLIAAYTALLAGYCLMENEDFEEKIRTWQPEGNFKTMVSVLKKFLHFMNLTATTALLRSLKPTERVVKYMEELDQTPEDRVSVKEKGKSEPVAFDAFGF